MSTIKTDDHETKTMKMIRMMNIKERMTKLNMTKYKADEMLENTKTRKHCKYEMMKMMK